MKCFVLFLLAVYGQIGLAQDLAAAKAFAGCYSLRIEGRLRNDYGNQVLPKQFELKTQRVSDGFVAINLDSRIRWDLSLSSWNVKDDGSLALNWSTGYVGWAIQLYRSGPNDLSGAARFWTDNGSERRSSRVVVRTARCGDSGNKS